MSTTINPPVIPEIIRASLLKRLVVAERAQKDAEGWIEHFNEQVKIFHDTAERRQRLKAKFPNEPRRWNMSLPDERRIDYPKQILAEATTEIEAIRAFLAHAIIEDETPDVVKPTIYKEHTIQPEFVPEKDQRMFKIVDPQGTPLLVMGFSLELAHKIIDES